MRTKLFTGSSVAIMVLLMFVSTSGQTPVAKANEVPEELLAMKLSIIEEAPERVGVVEKIRGARAPLVPEVELDETLPIDVELDACLDVIGVEFSEDYFEPTLPVLKTLLVPNEEEGCRSWNTTYMPYTAVTCVTSDQYALLNSPQAYTDEITGIRMYEGRYCIAVGSYYSQRIGTKLNLIMANGSVVKCITGDAKSDAHTDETHRYQAMDGSVAEVIVDYAYFSSTKQYPEELMGSILAIEVLG